MQRTALDTPAHSVLEPPHWRLPEEAMRKALETIEKDGKVTERPQMIRIEEL